MRHYRSMESEQKKVYNFRAKGIYLSNDTYISFRANLYTFFAALRNPAPHERRLAA